MRLKTRRNTEAAESSGAHIHDLQGFLRKSTVSKPTLPPSGTRSFNRLAGKIIIVIKRKTSAYLLSSDPPILVFTLNIPGSERDPAHLARPGRRAGIPDTKLPAANRVSGPPRSLGTGSPAALPAPRRSGPYQNSARGRVTAGLAQRS